MIRNHKKGRSKTSLTSFPLKNPWKKAVLSSVFKLLYCSLDRLRPRALYQYYLLAWAEFLSEKRQNVESRGSSQDFLFYRNLKGKNEFLKTQLLNHKILVENMYQKLQSVVNVFTPVICFTEILNGSSRPSRAMKQTSRCIECYFIMCPHFSFTKTTLCYLEVHKGNTEYLH